MEKLFSESEIFTSVRPLEITIQQQKSLCEEIAKEIIGNEWSNSNLEEITQDLEMINPTDNGYEIAKSLEGYNKSGNYFIDADFVDFFRSTL